MIDDCLSLAQMINLISNNYPCLGWRMAEKQAEVILRHFWTYIDDFLVLASDITVFGYIGLFRLNSGSPLPT